MDPLDIAGFGLDAFKLGYNLYTNKRDFDYQKALQQQIFNREDTAVQRRVADLKAAGINPNLAAGQGAGAGAVVSRSNTNDLGSALDTVTAINQIKQQKQQLENARKEGDLLSLQYSKDFFNNEIDLYKTLKSIGFDVEPEVWLDKNKHMNIALSHTGNSFDSNGNWYTNRTGENYFENELLKNFEMLNNSAEYLQREVNWQRADKWIDAVSTLGGFLPIPKFNFSTTKRR